MLAMCKGVSPRSFLLLTFLSRGVRLIDEPEVVELGDVGRGGVSEMNNMAEELQHEYEYNHYCTQLTHKELTGDNFFRIILVYFGRRVEK